MGKVSAEYKFVDSDLPPIPWYVEWVDHSTPLEGGWRNREDILGPVTILSIGWVLSEDTKTIYMCNHIDPSDFDHMGGQCIIKSCIIKAVQLKNP